MSLRALDKPCAHEKPTESATPAARLATSAAMRVALTHELSQPLSALATYIHAGRRLLKVDELDRELLAETMKKAEAEIKRTRDVLKRLRRFVTRDKAEPLPVNLLDLIRTVADRLANEASARAVRIDVDPATVPIVMVDPLQIKQVLVNILSNAIDAAADTRGGTVRVRCRHDSGTIEIVVDDNGRGIASEIAAHLFEPFQTTKTRGMGLGLPLSRQIVEAHGGRIWWEPTAPEGTRFHVVLPVNAPVRHEA
jgi:two-component system, LuxR family, sensor kinase FixL